ncbi:LysM peptidoglycan-binding domain-containing protein [Paenibacillus brasilensis]|uniref:Morphogenetic protein associated with SpoVID n=1 Tax=Paenibacillus brasilensis TaxID=128574 RepID=A0ABU0L325_9BACL|nr:LysM peptidoglycan-binding domain-containing protein [Paenibacillus brasilensis]MDQ0495551.1 morphogenetic protein associated with SpoVID [Paenibacillus brasilensis]
MKIHIVKKGDTLYLLAQKYNVALEKVIAANPQLADPNQLSIGEKIKIPTDPVAMETQPSTVYQHKVKQGDTLWKLSKAWNVPLKLIIDANSQLKNPNALLVGETVNIPHYKEDSSDPVENKKNTAVKPEMTQPKSESPTESPTKQELTQPKEESNQAESENMPSPKEQMTQPKETENPPKLPELKLPEVPMAPVNSAPPQIQPIVNQPAPPQIQPIVNQPAPPQIQPIVNQPAPPQIQPIVNQPAPPQIQPIVNQPVVPKPQLPVYVEKQPVTEKFCGCTSSESMVNSPWPVQQPAFDYSPQINTMPNSWYPGIGSPQPWGNAPVNTSFAEHTSPSVAPDHDCEHPWSWGAMQTGPINVHQTPYPAYSDCCPPGYYLSHEASENTPYPVYPPFMHQSYPQQHPESTVMGSQWGHTWGGGPQYGLPAGGYVSDYSQLQGQQSANSPYHPFAHGNTPVYPLEGYTTPYMFMPDYGCREGNAGAAPTFQGVQENVNNLTIASQNEVASSSKPKDGKARKGKTKVASSSTAKEEKIKAKVSGINDTLTNRKSRKPTTAKSRSSSYSSRSRKNPWIKD